MHWQSCKANYSQTCQATCVRARHPISFWSTQEGAWQIFWYSYTCKPQDMPIFMANYAIIYLSRTSSRFIRKRMKNFSKLVQACAILYKLGKLENWKVEKLRQKSCKFILKFSFDMNGASYEHPPISTCPKSDRKWSPIPQSGEFHFWQPSSSTTMATTSSISCSIFIPIFFYLDDNQCIWTPAVYNNHTFAKEHLLMCLHANSDFSWTCDHLFGWPTSQKSAKSPEKAASFLYICWC